MNDDFQPACPIPIAEYPHVLLAHGGGGRLMNQLIERLFAAAFKNPWLDQRHDGARLDAGSGRLAFSTDSYVVRPLFFPGGDIGTLAINGTVNDLAMCGARPKWLSAGFIIEEGLPMESLWRVVQSMKQAAETAHVRIVTGDTKVVDRGKGDGLYINTSGVGVIEQPRVIAPDSVRPGDVVLLSGDVGRHGMSIMSVREGLEFEGGIESDCAPVAGTVMQLLDAGLEVHCLRDLTRGGLSAALNEIAQTARLDIAIEESAVAVEESVRGACEILGFDPLYVANEGRFVAMVPEPQAGGALEILRRSNPQAARIGTVTEAGQGRVTLRSRIGAVRILDLLSGEQLPRIC